MFCIKYYPFEDYIKDADQVIIQYPKIVETPSQIEKCLIKFKDKMIIFKIEYNFDAIDCRLFQKMHKKYNNFKLKVFSFYKTQVNMIKESKIPFFFSDYVTEIDKLYELIKYEPTDMYVCEQLGFSLDKISKILHQNNIKVRVFPNISQSSSGETPGILTFFIRPEDIPFYSHYVDVFEIKADQKSQKTILKVYQQNKWFGNINQIISSFNGSLDSRFILGSFGAFRATCGKRCLYEVGSCNICPRTVQLGKTFEENKIVILPNSQNH